MSRLAARRFLFPVQAERVGREANKPSPVSGAPNPSGRRAEADHFSRTTVTDRLQQPTRDSPTKVDRRGPRLGPLFGLAPSGVCRAAAVTSGAVVSYTTVSPLPVPSRAIGGLLSVALSVVLRRPAVSRHSTLWSSDFPRARESARDPHSLPILSNSGKNAFQADSKDTGKDPSGQLRGKPKTH